MLKCCFIRPSGCIQATFARTYLENFRLWYVRAKQGKAKTILANPIWGTSPTNEQLDWPEHYRISLERALDNRINSVYSRKRYVFATFSSFLWFFLLNREFRFGPFGGPPGVRSAPYNNPGGPSQDEARPLVSTLPLPRPIGISNTKWCWTAEIYKKNYDLSGCLETRI